jgi:antitoxin component YwqK of YwqJK toxin-antitoxin module
MSAKKPRPKPHTVYHKDGSIWARGQTVNGLPTGYWEWFRKDGTRMRSGTFEEGHPVGTWTTYDREGTVHKVTLMKPKPH